MLSLVALSSRFCYSGYALANRWALSPLHTGCLWSYRMFVVIQDVCDHTGCLWSYRMSVVIQVVCGHTGCL